MIGLIEFETKRLCLRQWRPEDREPFAELNADPRVMEYFPALLDRAASDAMAERCQSLIAARGWGLWAVEKRNTSEFMGFVGLHVPIFEFPFSPCVEIGWRLAFQYWGKGFATEAAQASLRVGFELLGLLEIESFTAVRNFKSRAVMERLGMHETSQTFEHPHIPPGSFLRQHCLYRLLRDEWVMPPGMIFSVNQLSDVKRG